MSDESTTLMTDTAATTTEGAPASQPAVNAPATAAGTGGQQQPLQDGAGNGQGDPAKAGDQTDAAKATDGEQPKSDKPAGAPEKYTDFKAPEGMTFDGTVIGAFSEAAKEAGLSQDAAQKVLDKMAPALAERQTAQLKAASDGWANDAKSDKEFGGDKLAENLGVAKKGMKALATPALRKLLNESGLGNHPEIIRVFYRAGKALGEDGVVSGRGSAAKPGDARDLYPNSNMK
jgi:hypothetical protein